jgi:hypothetical protein
MELDESLIDIRHFCVEVIQVFCCLGRNNKRRKGKSDTSAFSFLSCSTLVHPPMKKRQMGGSGISQ